MVNIWLNNSKLFLVLSLMVVPTMIMLSVPHNEFIKRDLASDKVNLALRRTADGLLRDACDSTSLIPTILQVKDTVWQIKLNHSFDYDQLPKLLQTALNLYEISQPYQVAIRNCETNFIQLGYHYLDLTIRQDVPCTGRDMPRGCQYIEVTFIGFSKVENRYFSSILISVLFLFGLFFLFLFKRNFSNSLDIPTSDGANYLNFGKSKLDVGGQFLICGNDRHTLTFREAKLLHLFVSNQNQLLERELIIKNVWEDEGVMVGRSVDVFVSRLRKKISADPSISLTAVHGVGYRLEVNEFYD